MRLFLSGALLGALLSAGLAVTFIGAGPAADVDQRIHGTRGPTTTPVTPVETPAMSDAALSPAAVPGPRTSLSDDELLAEIRHLAEVPPPPDAGARALVVAGILADRSPPAVPPELLLWLARSDLVALRGLALRLATGAEPPPLQLVERIAVSDPDGALRAAGQATLGRLGLVDPRILDRLKAMAEAPQPAVRLAAVVASREGRDRVAEMSAIILTGLGDSNLEVRSTAITSLSGAGREGAIAALELLHSGNHESSHLPSLAEAIVAAGLLEEALTGSPRPEVVTAVLRELASRYSDQELPDPVRGLSGKFSTLLPLYRPTDIADEARFFRLAIHAEESDFVSSVALAPEQEVWVRRAALRALLAYEPSRSAGIDSSEVLLIDKPASPVLRVEVVREVAPWRRESEPCGTRIQELLFRVARDDNNDWVRAAAQGYVD